MKCRIALLLAVLFFGRAARADFVFPPYSLEKISAKSDVIVKATALETKLSADAWFEKVPGFAVFATRFKVVSVLKGEVKTDEVVFRHYARYSEAPAIITHSPPCYSFEPGESYLLWANRTEDGNLRQLWQDNSGQIGNDAIRVGNAMPVQGEIKNIVWNELTKMVSSDDLPNVRSALIKLSRFSGAGSDNTEGKPDFQLAPFVDLVRPFIESPDADTAFVAARAVQGAAAPLVAPELMRTAANHTTAKVRGVALKALAEVHTPAAEGAILRALDNDASPVVQREAIWALRKFPGAAAHEKRRAFAKHPDRDLRQAVAEATIWPFDNAQAALLDSMIDDSEERVRETAVRNLLNAPAPQAAPFWKKRRTHQIYGELFTVALAEKNIKPYLADICAIARRPFDPKRGWTSKHQRAWELLFDYVGEQPLESVNSPRMKQLFDALEASTSLEETDLLYCLYINAEMKGRAAAFRRRMEAKKSPQINAIFKRVDAELAKKAPAR